ncbi:putative methyltransferase DDB_G0268948 [Gigantopelta aegis]|uniref:putative methyltransferase DDB_G0268948 n=1 Tax=Gigantopelta aegis TaxID=1735272 RepID=UPI001B88838C|nr:putative methyltransferase DDB_G0268948 [Gigantopelta aegis]
MNKRLFEDSKHAELYAKFRPTYGQDVYERIIDFCKETSAEFKLAVDVGCGPGQSSKPLTGYFESVIGTDISKKQIENAVTNIANLQFRVGSAEDLDFLGNNSTDLVTVAQAIHWINTDAFYTEVSRVLKPGGSLVVYGYGNCTVDNQQAQDIQSQFDRDTLKDYWDVNAGHVDNHLEQFVLPFAGWRRDDTLKIVRHWSVDEFIGFVSSWSGWQAYLKVHPSSTQLDDIKSRFKALYADTKICVEWPVFMLMGHKPVET